MTEGMNRREFLGSTAAAGASLAFLSPLAALGADVTAARASAVTPVVEAWAPGVIGEGKRPDDARVRAMIERGIVELSGRSDLASAWRCFVRPDDVVGLKVNAAGGRAMATHRAVLETVVDGVRLAGVPNDRIFLWEQVEEYLSKYYLKTEKIDLEALGIRMTGCTPELRREHYMEGKPLPGFDTEPVKFDWGEVKVAELIANRFTAIINLPVLKDHVCSGVTMCLKNLSHAVVDSPWKCHDNGCDPHIADIVSIPSVRDKLRLHILDGLLGMAEGGPNFRSWDLTFVHERLLLSTDPVAIDSIGLGWIEEARAEMGHPPLAEAKNAISGTSGRTAHHIHTAALRGLGTDDPSKMEIRRIEIPAPRDESTEPPKKEG